MSVLFLGIDGGQTSTTALIGDGHGNVLAKGLGGPSNHVKAELGRERLSQAVIAAIASACDQLGASAAKTEFAAACMGFTGGIQDKEGVLRPLINCQRL